MDSLLFSRSRGLWISASILCGALLGGCGSEASPEVDKSDQDSQSSDDDDDTSSKKDAGSKKDGGSTQPKNPPATATPDAGSGKKDSGPAQNSDVKTGASGLPCDIQKITTKYCGACHGAKPVSGAPMSLVSQADFQAAAATDETKKVFDVVKTRVNAKTKPMPPIEVLAADELTTLNDWLDQGAPASDEQCAPSAMGPSNGEDIDVSDLECYRFLAHAQGNKDTKFKVGAAVDKYLNFGFQAPWQGTLYGLVVRPVIDNGDVLHHWLLYREPVADGSITETIGQHGSGELIHGWAPGGISMDFRKHGDVGFELPASTYAVEFHYNSTDPNAEDASGVELCGKKTPPKNIATLSWLGYDQGGTISYATGICAPSDEWTGTCEPASQQEPIHLLFMVPHLHQTGKHIKSIINGANGPRTLIDKAFDFAYQVSYETDEVLMPGETITTTCNFSAPNCAGQSTSQEMCYLFTYAYPKYALVDNGVEGTFMHGKGVCLGQ